MAANPNSPTHALPVRLQDALCQSQTDAGDALDHLAEQICSFDAAAAADARHDAAVLMLRRALNNIIACTTVGDAREQARLGLVYLWRLQQEDEIEDEQVQVNARLDAEQAMACNERIVMITAYQLTKRWPESPWEAIQRIRDSDGPEDAA